MPSRTSFYFYFGVEGLGGIDLDVEEDENVGLLFRWSTGVLSLTLALTGPRRAGFLYWQYARSGRLQNTSSRW